MESAMEGGRQLLAGAEPARFVAGLAHDLSEWYTQGGACKQWHSLRQLCTSCYVRVGTTGNELVGQLQPRHQRCYQ